MREIKFRAWHKEKKIMGEVLGIDILHKEIFFSNEDVDCYEHTDFKDIELMEYTGLKDKNEKEIYEGDIVKIDRQLFIVSYMEEKASYMLDEIDSFMSDYLSNYNISKLEIVGNIYENTIGTFCKNS